MVEEDKINNVKEETKTPPKGDLRGRTRLKITLIFLAIVLLLVLSFAKVTGYLAGRLIKDKVEEYSQGIYTVEFNNLLIDWRESEITLDGFAYQRMDSNTVINTEISFSAQTAKINLESILGVYLEKELHIESFSLDQPVVAIHQLLAPEKKQNFSFKTGNFYKEVQSFVKTFQIDDFRVNNLYLDFSQNDTVPVHYTVNDISFSIQNFLLDSAAMEAQKGFFFTESVSVLVKNQTIDLGDGIHQMHFDSLIISTLTNNVEVYNLKIDSVSHPFFDTDFSHWNQYQTDIPYAGIIGLNFLKAYTENVLEVDSLIFNNTSIHAVLGSIKKKRSKHSIAKIHRDTTVNNGVIKLLLGVFDEYQLHQLIINHANAELLIGTAHDTAQLKDLNLEFTGFVLDASDLIEEVYYPEFQGLKMDVANPRFEIPNGDRITAGKLEVSTYDSSIIITDVSVMGGKSKFKRARDIQIKSIELLGVQPREILLENEIDIEILNIKEPVFKLVNQNNQKQSINIDLKLFLTDKITGYSVKRLNIIDGKVDLNKGRNEIGSVNVHLDNFVLNEQSIQQNKFLLSSRSRIEVRKVKIEIPQSQHDLNISFLSIDSRGGQLKLKDWAITPNISDSSGVKFIANTQTELLIVNGVDLDHLYPIPEIDIRKVYLHKMEAKVNIISPDSTIPIEKGGLEKFLKGLKILKLANVHLDSMDVLIQKDGASLIKFSKGFFDTELLVADSSKLSLGQLLLTSDSNNFGAERLFMPLKEKQYMVSIDSIRKSDDSNLEISGFNLMPGFGVKLPDTVALMKVKIPKLTASEFRVLGRQNMDTLTLGKVVLYDPSFKFKLPVKKKQNAKPFELPQNLPSDFVNEMFQMIRTHGFSINNGYFELAKNDLEIKVKQLDLYTQDFEISKTSVWAPNRFLYSSDFDLQLKDLSLQLPGVNFCHYVDSVQYSFSPNALDVYGVYFNNRELMGGSNKTQLSFYLPKVSFNNPDIYSYLTDSVLIIEKIVSSNGFLEADIRKSQTNNSLIMPTSVPDFKLFKSIEVHDIDVNKMDVQLRTYANGRATPLEMDHFSLAVDTFHIFPGEKRDSNRLFWANNVGLSVQNIYTTVDDGLYEVGADKLWLSTKNQSLELSRMSLTPTVPRIEYALHKGGIQKDVFDLNIQKVSVLDLRFDKLLYDLEVEGSQIWVQGPLLNVFKDKRNAPETDVHKEILPEVFKKVPMKIYFDSVQVEDMKIRYEEFPKEGRKGGVIKLTRTHIKALNFTNDTVRLNQDSVLTIVMNSKFLDTANLYLKLEYQMLTPDNQFFMYSSLGSMDATLLNAYIEPCYSASINSGQVDKMTMQVIGNDSLAFGEMGLFYEDFKFQFLKVQNHHAKRFRSFIGNTVVRTNNKYSYFKKPQDIYFERNTQKGWINYLIKIELQGVQANAGIKKKQGKEAKKAYKDIWKQFSKESKTRLKIEGKLQKQKDKATKKSQRKLKRQLKKEK